MDHIHLTYLPWEGIFLQGGNQLEEISFSNKMARPLNVFLCSGHPSSRRLAFIEWNQTCSSSLLQSKAKEQSSAQRICNYLRNSQEFWVATASSALGSRLTKQLEKHKTSSPPYTPSTVASQQGTDPPCSQIKELLPSLRVRTEPSHHRDNQWGTGLPSQDRKTRHLPTLWALQLQPFRIKIMIWKKTSNKASNKH